MPGREPEDKHVLHRTSQADPHDQPDKSRKVAELDRQYWADQRPGARDGREVMAKKNPLIGGMIVLAVVKPVRRCFSLVVEHGHTRREKSAVVAIGDRQDGQHPEHHWHGM